jgi:hypothetical protein
MKENVEKSLAAKEETVVEVELTNIQKQYYRAIYERNYNVLLGKGGTLPSLMNIMMELRKCCNHPYLIKGVEDNVLGNSKDLAQINETLIQSSGKLVLIDKLLPKLKAQGSKVLIFSQMVRVLDILEDYLRYRKYKFERLDGGIRGNDRQAAIDRFSKPDSDIFVFLLSTRAGGLGINLTAANTVIIFDSDWNPQNDVQAQARCHRIGQTQMVKVYRLITRATYEYYMFECSSKKLGLDQAVLNQIEADNENSFVLDKNQLNSLLKFGAYDLTKDDDKAKKFCEEDIDKILEKATVIRTEVAGMSSFSKATFASTNTNPDVSLDDPDFWKKMLPNFKANNEEEEDDTKKSRRRVTRYAAKVEAQSSSSEDEEGESSSDDYVNNTQSNDSKLDRPIWSQQDHKHIRNVLPQFGYGRWEKIREQAKIPYSIEDVHAYAYSYAKKICDKLQLPLPQFLRKINNSEKKHELTPEQQDMYINDSAIASHFDRLPTKHIKALQTKLEDVSLLGNALRFVKNYLSHNFKTKPSNEDLLTCLAQSPVIPPLQFPEFAAAKEEEKNKNVADKMKWDVLHDYHLLLGFFKHGSGNIEPVQADSSLCFFDEPKNTVSVKVLNKRVKKLVKIILSQANHLLQESKPLSNRQQQTIPHAKPQERTYAPKDLQNPLSESSKKEKDEWSKKEKQDFIKFLISNGVPVDSSGNYDWDLVATKGLFKKKSGETLSQYFVQLLKLCRDQLAAKKKLINPAEDDADLSLSKSKKIVTRVMMMYKLRTEIIRDANLATTLAEMPPDPEFPSWYTVGVHDAALCKGVDKHGFANLDDICRDPSLPFVEVAKSLSQNQKKATLDFLLKPDDQNFFVDITLLQFPKEAIVARRIEDVVKYITQGGKPQQPRKKKATQATAKPSAAIIIPDLPLRVTDDLTLVRIGTTPPLIPEFCKNGVVYPVGYSVEKKFYDLKDVVNTTWYKKIILILII